MEEMEDLDFEALVAEEVEGFAEAGGIEEVAEDEDESAAAAALGEGFEAGQEARFASGLGRLAQELEHGVKAAFSAGKAEAAAEGFVEPEHVDAIEIGEGDVGEGGGDVAGLRELAHLAGWVAFGLPGHGGASIDEEVDVEVLLLLEEL